MNIKTTFLNENLKEEVYIKQLEGFILPENKKKICKLVKTLYDLKQALKK
jgi:hypothetical protein